MLPPALVLGLGAAADAAAVECARTLTAKVVVFDQPLMWNRLGAQNINGIMYALRRDVVQRNNNQPVGGVAPALDPAAESLPEAAGGVLTPGNVALRADKVPRPLALRVAAGDCLAVDFQNLLAQNANPFNPPQMNEAGQDFVLVKDDQVAARAAGFQVTGMQLVQSIEDDSSHVGVNPNSLAVNPGDRRTYHLFAEKEGQFVIASYGVTFGGEGQGGNTAGGMFGEVIVEPRNAAIYRSQLNRDEMNQVRMGRTAAGHPVVNYEATYRDDAVHQIEGKANLPIANMICLPGTRSVTMGACAANEIVHSDINAIIAFGGSPNTGQIAGNGHFPPETYPLESVGKRNPTVPNRLEPFRDFASIFHDEVVTAQAFPGWFQDPVLNFTLHGVRDSFMINYRSGGIGSEIIANRLGVGPMHDCLTCAYEEFFLASSTVGDPGQLTDIPANAGLEACDPALNNCAAVGPKANFVLYPDDPSNVHHSYTGDFVKFRNVHGGPAEQHIFHLHNHQWLFNANDDNSNYLDAQGIGPGSGYTYEINLGGSGNRNKTAGDAIFHCHFYPHFAQGMWYLWRVHEVFEEGTILQAMGDNRAPFSLFDGTPRHQVMAGGQIRTIPARNRALPDGEVVVGTPIPALVPLPGKPMAPMPGRLRIVSKDANGDGIQDSSQVQVIDREINPGFPFWIAGYEHTVGQRVSSPVLDMITANEAAALAGSDPLWSHPGFVAGADGWDGGLPRFTTDGFLAGGIAAAVQTRLDFSKDILKAKPFFFPEAGTDLEQTQMRFQAQRCHDSFLPDGTPAACAGSDFTGDGLPDEGGFVVNGQPPVPGAPFNEPCIDDRGRLLDANTVGEFFSGETLHGLNTLGNSTFNAAAPRVYKAANVQFDAVFNKLGYHFPQQRIITLWQDVVPTIEQRRPPEPFVLRLNTFDCANYHHTNLVPKVYELDDYEVRTPTDIIGQHIHLPKWDLTTADGSANGWNYEDGTLSPEMVVELIEAVNAFNTDPANAPVVTDVMGNPVTSSDGNTLSPANVELHPSAHPFFGNTPFAERWLGARTTTQRWFADPVVNVDGFDRGLGIIFTHDHFGPSTHQQIGLYATVLTEPAGSLWRHNETGVQLGDAAVAGDNGRIDGGPTSWQAAIVTKDNGLSNVGAGELDDFREFYFEHSDFQHSYELGVFVGVGPDGLPITPHDINNPWSDANLPAVIGAPSIRESFRFAQQPNIRRAVMDVFDIFPDNVQSPVRCPVLPGGIAPQRPCPEAITADDPGMFVVNYRNEPLMARIFDPNKIGPDGRPGAQTDGLAGDLGFALQSRTDRAIPALNTKLGLAPAGYAGDPAGEVFLPPITQLSALDPGDPFTPMPRAYVGDQVRIKTQSGGDEEEHAWSIHGLKWLQAGSGHGSAGNSGWRNSQTTGISEQFTLSMPASIAPNQEFNRTPGDPFFARTADYAYTSNASATGYEWGNWGLVRTYAAQRNDLFRLPDSGAPALAVVNGLDFFKRGEGLSVCPRDAPRREYDVTVALANDILPNPGAGVTLARPEFLSVPGLHAGANIDPNGGTLIYNSRPTVIPAGQVVDEETGEVTITPERRGPLHDPTAILYVNTGDLVATDPLCGDVTSSACGAKLADTAPVEPIVIRAAAGDCVVVTLRSRLPTVMPDLPTRTINGLVVARDRNVGNPLEGVHWFQTNHYRPSSHTGMHPQLVSYDVTRSDGANVGLNPVSTVPPGGRKTFRWYAGDLRPTKLGPLPLVRLEPTPVEFGSFGISSADKIKHHQKGLIGAGAVYPPGSVWAVDAGRHTAASVKSQSSGPFRDFTSIWQKGINLYWGGDGDSVANTESEGGGIAEDTYDSGQMAINYGTEPLWFRFGLNPDDVNGINGVANANLAYANALVGEDPQTAVFPAVPGDAFRLHVLESAGQMRKSVPTLHGHVWLRDPYLCPGSAHAGLPGKCATDEVGSRALGDNPIGFAIGAFQSLMPSGHFEIVQASAGGANAVPGDYLFRDHMGLGNLDGLWGIVRVGASVATP